MAKRELTEHQKKFIEALFEKKGNVTEAATVAGISSSEGYRLAKTLKDEIIELAKETLALHSVRAVHTLTGALDDDAPVHRDRLEAAKQILDRSGVVKEEKQQIEIKHGIFILPPKDME